MAPRPVTSEIASATSAVGFAAAMRRKYRLRSKRRPPHIPRCWSGPAVMTRFEGVGLYRVAVLEHQHKLVAAAIETILRRLDRLPLAQTTTSLSASPSFTACRDQRVEVLPIDEHEQNASVPRVVLAAP